MNTRDLILRNARAAWFSLMFAMMLPAMADLPVVDAGTQLAPRSNFNIPANPKEGCDPFFPGSLRPYEIAVVPGAHTSDLTTLRLNGISGSPDRRLAIINNVTFGVGDEAEVHTSQGRIRIHCIEITGNTVVIESDGQRQELHYGDNGDKP
jgi:hypothetical protein